MKVGVFLFACLAIHGIQAISNSNSAPANNRVEDSGSTSDDDDFSINMSELNEMTDLQEPKVSDTHPKKSRALQKDTGSTRSTRSSRRRRERGSAPAKKCEKGPSGAACRAYKNSKKKTKRVRRKRSRGFRGPLLDCQISIRIYPLLFWARTGTLDFKVLFRSVCLRTPVMMYFMVPWNKQYDLYPHAHPSFVALVLFGKEYKFKFVDPYERGTFPDINVAYKGVRAHPTRLKKVINTFEDNNMILWPAEGVSDFNSADVRRLTVLDNPFPCEIRNKRRVLFCEVK